ncbi:MAG: type II toxin-antitoxin system mRNA interferase toxin, RelE/StbE family [Patescibacteria group bacterium]|nr:type II toxin-antitoxin system mRNA interferase toxin, RelE/StbE family [Patescibacteria group bacterium]
MQINYTVRFVKQYNKFDFELKKEIKEKIEFFKDFKNHKSLKVHKLHGAQKDRYGFSVNYKIRVVFRYLSKQEVVFLVIGDHDIYK